MNRSVVICLLAVFASTNIASAQLTHGIVLNPGERLVSVNGKPVQQAGNVTTTNGTIVLANHVQVANQTQVAPSNDSQSTAGGSFYHGSDQQRAQAEANYMAANGVRGHVGGTIGRFEGVGWSGGGTPNTCTPSQAMTLTADATAHGPSGTYRVRAWR